MKMCKKKKEKDRQLGERKENKKYRFNSTKRGERENALEHPILEGFSTGRSSEEGALTRTEPMLLRLLLLLQLLNSNPW